jgi:pimeloyl-ACP methyl ester carboxylesterase
MPTEALDTGTQEPALIFLSGLGDPAAWWFTVPSAGEALPHWAGNSRAGTPGIAATLAQHGRMIAYDRAGVGSNPAPDHDRSWLELYTELEAVIRAAQLTRPPVLIGHSLGGLIAYSYARRRPSALSGLVLLDPTPPPLAPKTHGPMPERLALTHFEPADVAPGVLEDLPLLLIAPGHAELAPERQTRFEWRRAQHERLLYTSVRSRAVWTSQAGHYVHLDTPGEVNAAVLELLEHVGRG